MVTDESVIRVSALRMNYGTRAAVDDANFDVRRSEVFGLLGPNGAGKTSIVEILEGHRRRTGGLARVLGHDPGNADSAWRNRIGIVPQSGADHDGWLVAEVVAQIGRCYSDPMPTPEALALVGLADRGRAGVAELSGGQRRRLDLALALVGRPEVLFLDEPTTGLDPQARRDCWELIRVLRSAGTSVLLTTHYLDEVEQLADRVAVLVGGRVLEITTPGELGDVNTVEVVWREDGQIRTTTTLHSGQVLDRLRDRMGPDIPGLEVRRLSLESRYLQLLETAAVGSDTPGDGRTQT
jgi:ABC-2 type transport system ATP-binding protein